MKFNRLQRYFQSEQPQSPPAREAARPGFVAVSLTELPPEMRTAMQDNRGLYEWAYRNAQQSAASTWDDGLDFGDYSI